MPFAHSQNTSDPTSASPFEIGLLTISSLLLLIPLGWLLLAYLAYGIASLRALATRDEGMKREGVAEFFSDRDGDCGVFDAWPQEGI